MICPYCGEPISKDKMLLYFDDVGKFDIVQMVLDTVENTNDAIQSHNKEHGNYFNYWEFRNNKAKGEKGIVVDIHKLADVIGSEEDYVTPVKGAENRRLRIHLDLDNPMKSFFSLVGVYTLEPCDYLCPECWNFFPKNYFDHDNYTVLLIAPTSTGKSVLCASMLADTCHRVIGEKIPNDQDRIIGVANYITEETIQRAWKEAVQEFEWHTDTETGDQVFHKLPEGTDNVPPVFFTFTLQRPGEKDYTFNLALVDTKGEGWLKDDPGVTTFLDKCDGVLYLCEPEQSTKLIRLHNPADGAGRNPESADMSAGYAEEGMPFDDGAQSEEEKASGTQQNSKKLHVKVSSGGIFNKYFLIANTKVAKDIPIAFVLTKFDQLLEGEQKKYRLADGCEPLFLEQLKTFHDPLTRKSLLDSSELMLHNVAATSLFKTLFGELNINNGIFRNVNCFCVSSFTGEPVNDMLTQEQYGKPYNIHMPFLWLLSQMLRKRADKAAEREAERKQSQTSGFRRTGTSDAGGRRDARRQTAHPEQERYSARQVNELIDDD